MQPGNCRECNSSRLGAAVTTAPDIVTAALEYAALGWPVIPPPYPYGGRLLL